MESLESNNQTTEVVTTATTPPSTDAAQAANSEAAKGRSTLHGSSYHLRLAMIILLRAYNLHREDKLNQFVIKMEDPTAGKFDDVVFRYTSASSPTVGAVYIQAKHKQKSSSATPTKDASFITKRALLKHWDSKAQFSVSMYFASYLEIHQKSSSGTPPKYMLCTNARIDVNVMHYFKSQEYEPDDIMYFYKDIGASCYRFDYEKVVDVLINESRKASVEKLGQFWAMYVKNGKEMKSNVFLFEVYRKLIAECVEKVKRGMFKFKPEFITANNSTPMGRVSATFRNEYVKLLSDENQNDSSIKWNELEICIEDTFIDANPPEAGSYYKQVDHAFKTFCEQFVFVCESLDEAKMVKKSVERIPLWVLDRDATNSNFFFDMFESMKNIPIEFKQLKTMFSKITPNESVDKLTGTPNKNVNQWQQEYRNVRIKEELLREMELYKCIEDKPFVGVYTFRVSTGMKISSLIVAQTLALANCPYLFLDSRATVLKQNFLRILHQVMEFMADVNPFNTNVIAILGQFEHKINKEIKSLAKYYRLKIILIEKLDGNRTSEDVFYVHHLTDDARKKLYQQQSVLYPFGTSVAVNDILRDEDSLSYLGKILTKGDEADDKENERSNVYQFEALKPRYVSRTIVPYNTALPSALNEDDLSTDLNYPSKDEEISFDQISFVNKNIRSMLDTIISSEDEFDKLPDALRHGDDKEKVYIFVDEAGTGKSAYLTWLSTRLSATEDSLYVVRVEVLKHSAAFAQLSRSHPNDIDDITALTFLYRLVYGLQYVINITKTNPAGNYLENEQLNKIVQLLHLSDGKILLDEDELKAADLTSAQSLEIRLFQMKFNERKLILMLDGFDTIHPFYSAFGFKCVAKLASFEAIRTVYISTRPYNMMAEFARSFPSSSMFRLVPFRQRDQLLYWRKCLDSEMEHYKQCTASDRITGIAVLYSAILNNLGELYRLPLFLKVSSEVALPLLKPHIHFLQHTVSKQWFMQTKLIKLKLFEHFVSRKLKLLNEEKSGSTDSISDNPVHQIKATETNAQVKRKHGLLAMHVLFSADIRDELMYSADQEEAAENLQDIVDGTEKTGIVPRLENNVPTFTHRILAEYFTGYWMYENKDRMKHGGIFWSRSFWTPQLLVMRTFFDQMILEGSRDGCEIHYAVVNKSSEHVRDLLSNDGTAAFVKDAAGRLPLHLAIVYSMEDVFQAENIRSGIINVRDTLFGWSALDYAFIVGVEATIHKLIDFGATVNESTLLQQICSNNLKDLLNDALNYGEWLQSNPKSRNIANSLHSGVAKYLLNERPIDIFASHDELDSLSVIEFCIKHNMVGVFRQCISLMNDHSKISSEVYKDLLELAVESKAHHIVNCFLEE
ncbi:uncharacterized protein LOC133393060 [Anopheles gambiae]|uniref:uncharacterized protein LOC133393060 n=1 Tax=Anopheles gambiae TaxID=7165 RepID=UPI002AC9B5BA|nr:uncharacterized protein LOC133393060 [Anopheles gambiae]XP_061512283.1 uncharacterized protein LOC133393060 [Anopheles gambiae]XP_061512284.1 uncharacterized protein LOC133393060 [Anopheles gambiae]